MRITTIDEYLQAMRESFVPEKAGNVRVVLQYQFTGSQNGACHAVIADGAISVAAGTHPAPTATVTADFDLWMRILVYELDAVLALEDGLYEAEGDLETLMASDLWFRR
jgi:putative sterol carrier protein